MASRIVSPDIQACFRRVFAFYLPSLRCTSFVWSNDGNGREAIHYVVTVLPKALPSLKHISLTSFADLIGYHQFPDCPALERAEISNRSIPYPLFWGESFAHVTTLSFGNLASWGDCDMITLSLFPLLHDLTLFNEHGRTSLYGIYQRLQPPITFQRLQILRVHGHIPLGGLTRLVAPALKELHLKANDEHFTSLDSLQYSFKRLCQYIYAILPKAVRAKEPQWATNLSWLVDKCTKVKALYVSKWMEEECQILMPRRNFVLHVQ